MSKKGGVNMRKIAIMLIIVFLVYFTTSKMFIA